MSAISTETDTAIGIVHTIAQLERDQSELLKKVACAAKKGGAIHPTPEEWEILKRYDWLRHPTQRSDRTVRSDLLLGTSFLRDEVVEYILSFVSTEGEMSLPA